MLGHLGSSLAFAGNGRPLATDPRVDVSITHSRDVGVVAVARMCLVGVDLEAGRWLWDESLARRACTERESKFLSTTLIPSRNLCLKTLWTRKEACLKLLGVGLSMPPSRVDVLDDRAVLLGRRPEHHSRIMTSRIHLHSWRLDGTVLTVATTVKDPTMSLPGPFRSIRMVDG